MKFPRFAVAATALALVTTTLAGCTTISTLYKAYGPKQTDAPAATSSAAPTGLIELKVGDCLDKTALEDNDRETDPFVKCTQKHDLEVYTQVTLKGKTYPSVEEIANIASTECATAFTKFVGVDFGISSLDFVYYYPTESSWAAGDRGVDCVIFDPDGRHAGTFKNAKR